MILGGIPMGLLSNSCEAIEQESGIFWLNLHAKSYINSIANSQENIALASSNIEYWKTLKKNMISQSDLHVVDFDK